MLFPEEPVQLQVPVFEGINFTADEIHELLSLFQSGPHPANSNSGSDTCRPVFSVEERKHRRMLSNRESARRSRWRKKTHLENITNQLNRLQRENRELKNRLRLVSNQCQIEQSQTDRLQIELLILQRRLAGLHQFLVNMQPQIQYNYTTHEP